MLIRQYWDLEASNGQTRKTQVYILWDTVRSCRLGRHKSTFYDILFGRSHHGRDRRYKGYPCDTRTTKQIQKGKQNVAVISTQWLILLPIQKKQYVKTWNQFRIPFDREFLWTRYWYCVGGTQRWGISWVVQKLPASWIQLCNAR